MMCIVIIAQYADCTPCGFGSRQKVRSVVHPRAAILHFDLRKLGEGLRTPGWIPGLHLRRGAAAERGPGSGAGGGPRCHWRQFGAGGVADFFLLAQLGFGRGRGLSTGRPVQRRLVPRASQPAPRILTAGQIAF